MLFRSFKFIPLPIIFHPDCVHWPQLELFLFFFRPALEAPSCRSSNGLIVRVERPDGSTIFFKSPFPSSEESLRSKKGRYVNVEDYRKARNKDGATKKSGESYFYYRN